MAGLVEKLPGTHELLAMETALLIATAASRDIDVSVWFGEKGSGGKIPVRDFDAKITSLATTMGIGQDVETKRELELAISTLALRMAHTVCASGEDEYGQLLIDVSYFFKLCQEKVDKYLADIDDHESTPIETAPASNHMDLQENDAKNFRNWSAGEYDINGNLLVPATETVSKTKTDEDHDAVQISVEDYIQDLKQKATGPRPKSAPSGARALSRGETVEQTLFGDSSTGDLNNQGAATDALFSSPIQLRVSDSMQRWSEVKQFPSSPYDEEIEFHDDDADAEDAEHVYAIQRGSAKAQIHNNSERPAVHSRGVRADKPAKLPASQPVSQVDWGAENRAFLQLTSHMPSKSEVQKKTTGASATNGSAQTQQAKASPGNRPSSAPRMPQRSSTPTQLRPASAHTLATNQHRPQSASRRGGPEQKLPLTAAQQERVRDLLQNQLRDTVKKTDCYHLVQVHLGFVDSYTMIPPRGAIVQSKKQEFISDRVLHAAFIAGRLFLNDAQIKALKQLVATFAKDYRRLYKERADKLIKISEELEEQLPIHIFNPAHNVNAEWLRRYLLHLRLTKREALPKREGSAEANVLHALNTSSIASKDIAAATAPAVAEDPVDGNQQTDAPTDSKTPILWKEWLGKKLQHEMERGPVKPKDFQKALNGQNHPLTKEDIEHLLRTHRILSPDALQQEIEFRIESWALDCDGRRDFQHQLNVKIRTYLWEQKVQPKTVRLPKDESGYWRIWRSIPAEERAEIRESLIRQLVDEKREQLTNGEKVKNEISRSLYWQFDEARKERELPWTEWLPSHLDKCRRNLDKFKKDESERLKIANKQKRRRKSMASLQAIESNLKDVGKSLDAHHQMQLQKGIVSLRRAAQENGLGRNGIVTKEEFDTHIRRILSPYVPFDDTFIENHQLDKDAQPTSLTRFAEEWRERIQGLFTSDPKATVDRVVADKQKQEESVKISFSSWLTEKKRREESNERKRGEDKIREEANKEQRKKKSEKAYKKWLKMRNQNQYKSMVDNKYHPIPGVIAASHDKKWDNEREIPRRDRERDEREPVGGKVRFSKTK